MNHQARPLGPRSKALVSRRGALKFAAGALGAFEAASSAKAAEPQLPGADLPAPGPHTMAEWPISKEMLAFSAYISQARDRPLTAEVAEKTKWHILDSFAAIVSSTQLPGGEASIRKAITGPTSPPRAKPWIMRNSTARTGAAAPILA